MTKLFLTSNGLSNESLREALRGMLGKPTKQSNMVFVPTGSWPVRGDKTWLVDDIRRAHGMGWKNFDMLDLAAIADWPKKLWLPVFEQADVIMLCGGHAPYLSYWLEESGLKDELPKLLKDKIYIGISAGSIVATQSMATSSSELRKRANLPDDEAKQTPPGQTSDKTLGLVDFLFRPHYNNKMFPLATKDFMQKVADDAQKPVYLVDDGSAVRVVGDKVDVVSEGKWHLLK